MNITSLNMTVFAIAGIIVAAVHCVSALPTAKSINAASHSKNTTDVQGDRELIFCKYFDLQYSYWKIMWFSSRCVTDFSVPELAMLLYLRESSRLRKKTWLGYKAWSTVHSRIIHVPLSRRNPLLWTQHIEHSCPNKIRLTVKHGDFHHRFIIKKITSDDDFSMNSSVSDSFFVY